MTNLKIQFIFAVILSKLILKTVKLLGSEGSSLPGLICNKIEPRAIEYFANQCTEQLILISGTNGKTTTCRIASKLLPSQTVYNKSGSNMLRGHTSAFIEKSNWLGIINSKNALLEVDEAILPTLVSTIKPTKIILLNLFRDQLDRYGEIDSIVQKWQLALIKNIPQNCGLYINADDPNLAYLAHNINHPQTVYWGINDPKIGTEKETSTLDAIISPQSGKPLLYTKYYLSHLGVYQEIDNSFKRPTLNIEATNCNISDNNVKFDYTAQNGAKIQNIIINLPGIYNLYNAIAGLSVIDYQKNNLNIEKTKNLLSSVKSAFGRYEKVNLGHNVQTICLIKNPAGANEVLRTISQYPEINLTILANDNLADGIDVSWYWDCNFETVVQNTKNVFCGGSRAQDMALRLKYANLKNTIQIENNIYKIINTLKHKPKSNTPNFILSTYTANLEVQKILKKMKVKQEYWKE